MQSMSIPAAKTQPSRPVDAAAAGGKIVIARAGRPVARLVPLAGPVRMPQRVLGALAGRLRVPTDLDAPLADEALDDFGGALMRLLVAQALAGPMRLHTAGPLLPPCSKLVTLVG